MGKKETPLARFGKKRAAEDAKRDSWARGLLKRAERAADLPAADWAGRCHQVSCAIVDAGLVPGGVAVYGAWNGPVAPGTLFSGRPIIRHGWIALPDGRVVDPTRWVFEGSRPKRTAEERKAAGIEPGFMKKRRG